MKLVVPLQVVRTLLIEMVFYVPELNRVSRCSFQEVGLMISKASKNDVLGNLAESLVDRSVAKSVTNFQGVK